MNDGIRVCELPSEHLFDGLVVRSEAGLVQREAAFRLDFVLQRIAEGAELVGDAAEEDGAACFSRQISGNRNFSREINILNGIEQLDAFLHRALKCRLTGD